MNSPTKPLAASDNTDSASLPVPTLATPDSGSALDPAVVGDGATKAIAADQSAGFEPLLPATSEDQPAETARSGVSKTYTDILLNGGHLSC